MILNDEQIAVLDSGAEVEEQRGADPLVTELAVGDTLLVSGMTRPGSRLAEVVSIREIPTGSWLRRRFEKAGTLKIILTLKLKEDPV